jgi:hypothetical protein
MVGPFQPPFVMDREAYESKIKELEERAKSSGRPASFDDMAEIRDIARQHAYDTEFSIICTAAIRGDWEPAKERCRKERAEKGEETARALMRSYQRAVKDKKRTIRT